MATTDPGERQTQKSQKIECYLVYVGYQIKSLYFRIRGINHKLYTFYSCLIRHRYRHRGQSSIIRRVVHSTVSRTGKRHYGEADERGTIIRHASGLIKTRDDRPVTQDWDDGRKIMQKRILLCAGRVTSGRPGEAGVPRTCEYH